MFHRRFKYILSLGITVLIASSALAVVPSGYYYFAANKKQAALKTALHTYCAPMKELEYGGGAGFTWQGFFSTDQNADGTVIDMYSDSIRHFNGFKAVSGMNIEHSLPKSWWGAYPNGAYKDLFHLYPADAITNITKSNLPLGEVTGTPTLDNGVTKIGANGFESFYTENCFEPADEFKGDFARSYFYISTIYENFAPLWSSPMMNNNTYPVWKPWAVDLLLKWSHQDPVSSKELKRIEAIYAIQGNRNPFIDYPDLADYIWGKDTLNVYPFPVETNPFLVMPRRGTTIDFGVILQTDKRTMTLHIQGANISTDLQVSLAKNSPALALSSLTIPASAAVSGFDLSVTFTPTATGFVRDSLIIQGGGLAEKLSIPVKALASADFITLEPTEVTPIGGTLQWISDPAATDYRLNVYQGDTRAGDLIISTYVDGSSWNKALEIYNGTGKTIDLSNYSLQKQSNGSGPFGSTLKLSGTLDNTKSYVIVSRNCTTVDLNALAQLRADSVLQFNGNDAVALLRSGVTIDMVGQADAGADVIWGDKVTLQRKPGVTHPLSTFNGSEWTVLPNDSYAMLGNHPMTLAASSSYQLQDVLTGKNTTYAVQDLIPNNNYTYSVEAIRPDENTVALNTMQLHTSSLDAPEISEAGNIQSNRFTANWGEAAYASGYLLDVFNVNGQADTTEVEGFDNVGSTGTPLPLGWSGTASGNYTTNTSQGIAIPSLAFLNFGEWLTTKTYPQPVSKLNFMCRFVTYKAGASFIVDGLSNGNWVRIDSIISKNNTKTYPSYTFDNSQGFTSFRFTFDKVTGGNLSLDDVSATYGNQDTIYVVKDKPVSSLYSTVSDLKENTPYFYRVKATLGSSVSAASETMGVRTVTSSRIPEHNSSSLIIMPTKAGISVYGLQGGELIQVYTLTGICLSQTKGVSTHQDIPMHQSGIFLIHIQDRTSSSTYKMIQ